MEPRVLNPIQIQLLEVFSYVKDEATLFEIRKAVSSYFAQRVDEEMDRLWDEGKITQETIEEWSKEHMRTPYKCKD